MPNQSGTAGANTGDGENDKELTLPEVDPTAATPEQVEQLVTVAKTALGQKAHWRAKAIDPETGKPFKELLEATKSTLPTKPPTPAELTPEADARLKRLEMSEEKRQFQFANNLTPEEADNVFAVASGMGIKPSEALTHPFVKSGLEALRQTNKARSATLSPSSRSPVVEGKSFKDMDAKERAKNFSQVVAQTRK